MTLKEKFADRAASALEDSVQAKKLFWEESSSAFWATAEELLACIHRGGKVLIFGNGGSACDALHFAGEYVNRFRLDRLPLSAVALTSDGPLITCIGNDFGFDFIFEKQVQALARPQDIVIGISTSGNSKNVILGLQAGRNVGAKTVALLGGNGGRILAECKPDFVLNVASSKDTPRIQECHEWILHTLCEVVEAGFASK